MINETEDIETKINPAINLEKSISRQRLVYKISLWSILVDFFSYIIIAIWVFFPILPILAAIQGAQTPIWEILCCVIFEIFMITSIWVKNVFVKINGKNPVDNRKDMLEILNEFYEDLEFQVNDEKMIRSYLPTGRPVWGRNITVVFDNDMILLNISKLGKADNPTVIHAIKNYFRAKSIAKYYKETK